MSATEPRESQNARDGESEKRASLRSFGHPLPKRSPGGFDVLFAAEWLCRDHGRGGCVPEGWSAVTGPEELERWEAAWDESPQPRRFFPRELLADSRILLLYDITRGVDIATKRDKLGHLLPPDAKSKPKRDGSD